MSGAPEIADRALFDAVMTAFTDFLHGDAAVRACIAGHGRDYEAGDGSWRFTLPVLHEFLGTRDAYVAQMTYTAFRSRLYRLPVNQALGNRGAAVGIARGTGHVDDTVYVLRIQAAKSAPSQPFGAGSNNDAAAAGFDGK